MLWARKVNRAKWPPKWDGGPPGELPADCFTCGCLKTGANRLSVWAAESKSHLSNVLLALASGHQNFDTFDIVVVSAADLESRGFVLDKESEGKTPVEDLRKSHADIVDLNHEKLGTLASLFASNIAGNNLLRFRSSEIRAELLSAVKSNRVSLERLPERLQEKLSPLLTA